MLLIALEEEEDAPGPSSRARVPLLVEAIEKVNPSLVLTGVLSTDDLYGELAPQLGAKLNWPQVSAISDVQIQDSMATVRQEYSGGFAAQLEVDLPAVIGLQAATSPPRYVAGSKLRELLKVDVPELEVSAEFGTDLTESTLLELPNTSGSAEMINGDVNAISERVHEILVERGLV